jgi:WD40 repeat protein
MPANSLEWSPVPKRAQSREVDGARRLYEASWSPDGKWFAVGYGFALVLFDARTQKQIAQIDQDGYHVEHLAFSPDSKLVATSFGNEVALWNVKTRKRLRVFHNDPNGVVHVAFSPDGSQLATCGDINSYCLWEVSSGKRLRRCTDRGTYRSSVFSPDGSKLAMAGFTNKVLLVDATSNKRLADWAGHKHIVNGVDFSPEGTRLVSGSHDGTVRLWDVAAGKEVAALGKHRCRIDSVAFSPDGKHVASCDVRGNVLVSSADDLKVEATLRAPSGLDKICWSPAGDQLAGSALEGITIWAWPTGKPLRQLTST